MSKSLATVIIVSLMIFWEIVNPFIKFESSKTKDYFFNGAVGLFNSVVSSLSVGLVYSYIFSNELFLIPKPVTAHPLYWVFGFLVLDLYIYSWHRFAMHGNKFGFSLHKLHHEDKQMNSTTAFRFNTIEVLLSQIPRIGLIYIFSIPLQLFLIYEIVFLILNVFQHSNISVGKKLDRILSFLIITPNLHRVHHSVDIKESNTNFSTILSLWDKLLGSRKYRAKFGDDFKFGLE